MSNFNSCHPLPPISYKLPPSSILPCLAKTKSFCYYAFYKEEFIVRHMRIEIKREKCISVASCVALAANTFELDDQGIAVVKKDGALWNEGVIEIEDNGDTREQIIAAAESCPTKAIFLYENAGARIYPKEGEEL